MSSVVFTSLSTSAAILGGPSSSAMGSTSLAFSSTLLGGYAFFFAVDASNSAGGLVANSPIGLVASDPLRKELLVVFMEDVGNKLGNGGMAGNVTNDGTLGLVVIVHTCQSTDNIKKRPYIFDKSRFDKIFHTLLNLDNIFSNFK